MKSDEKIHLLLQKRAQLARDGSAMDRIAALLDPEGFAEVGAFTGQRPTEFAPARAAQPCEGVLTGYGTVDGVPVCVFSQDRSKASAAMSEMQAEKICALLDVASKSRCPVVGFFDSLGARIAEGVDALHGYGRIAAKLASLSGVVPTIGVISGACGGAAAMLALSFDFLIMEENAELYGHSPRVLEAALGEKRPLSGAAHAAKEGLVHFTAANSAEASAIARQLLAFLPQNNGGFTRFFDATDDINRPLGQNIFSAEDGLSVTERLQNVADNGVVLEVSRAFAADSMVTAFGRLGGETVGFIANAGDISAEGARKAARFVGICDSFEIPLITITDTAGVALCAQFEAQGGMKAVAALTAAYADAEVPKITLIAGKAIGTGYIAMGSKALGADFVLALPFAEISPLPVESAVTFLFEEQLAAAKDPQAERESLYAQFRDGLASPYEAARRGYVDDVILPAEVRQRLLYAAELFSCKEPSARPAKKHGNLPI